MEAIEIIQKVKQIISQQLSIDISRVKETALIGSDLGADSLDTAEIAMMIQDEFNYNLTDQEIARVKTVKDLVDVLNNALVKK